MRKLYNVGGAGHKGAGFAMPPVNYLLPAISGTDELAVSDGVWIGSPAVYTFQWRRNGVDLPGEIGNTYIPTVDDMGHTITVAVTATNGAGVATVATNGFTPSEAGAGDFLTSFGDITFDENRVYGLTPDSGDPIYMSGDIVVDLAGADSTKMALVYHKDYIKPTISGAALSESGDYVEGVLNIIRLKYDGSSVQVAYHGQL